MNQPQRTSLTEPVAEPSAPLSLQARERLTDIDAINLQSVMSFGSAAQTSLTDVSDRMLEQVRSKDLGAAGDALNEMVLTLRGFDTEATAGRRPVGWFGRLLGKTRGAARLVQRYEAARDQIEAVGARLQQHQNDLLFDVESLERLYRANLQYVHELEAYIEAGDVKLAELDQRLNRLATEQAQSEETLPAQRERDLRSLRDQLDRRIHDLRLTRQVALQALPSIRLVQDNDKSLVAQIDSTLVNTLPLWRQQLAQAVTIQRASEAAETLAAANDLTNDLLKANAKQLRDANRNTLEQRERGVFDIDAIAEANQTLIATIEDSLKIAAEGREMRDQAEGELQELEKALREALRRA